MKEERKEECLSLEASENNKTHRLNTEPATPGDADELARIDEEAGELEDLGTSGQMEETNDPGGHNRALGAALPLLVTANRR